MQTIPTSKHTYGKAVVTKEATETETGIKTKTCTACGKTAEEEIPVLGTSSETISSEKNDEALSESKQNVIAVIRNIFIWMIAISMVVAVGGVVAAIIIVKKKK